MKIITNSRSRNHINRMLRYSDKDLEIINKEKSANPDIEPFVTRAGIQKQLDALDKQGFIYIGKVSKDNNRFTIINLGVEVTDVN